MSRAVYLAAAAAETAAGVDAATIADACRAAHVGPSTVRFCSLGVDVEVPYQRLAAAEGAALRVARRVCGDARGAGLFVGSSSSGIAGHERAYAEARAAGRDEFPIFAPDQSRCAREVQTALALHGPYYAISTACSSAANALLYAAHALRDGMLDDALVLGYEEENHVSQQGFFSLMLSTRTQHRPFDAERDGITLGEGAAALRLSTSAAGARWALLGGASLCDSSHPTNPSAQCIAETMREALADAGIEAADVAAIKAHGTGTRANDLAEGLALREVFGTQLPPFTSLKPVLGHTLGACGAVETAAFIACLERGFVPPTAGFAQVDPELGIAPLQAAGAWRGGIALLNFFGFGGNNCALLLRELAPC